MVEAADVQMAESGVPMPVLGMDLGSYIATTGILADGPDIQIQESVRDRRKTSVAISFRAK